MHAPPAFQVTVQRFGAWHALLIGLALGVIGVLWAWCAAGSYRLYPSIASLALAIGACRSLWSLGNVQPFSLRWDTQQWAVDEATARGHEKHTGQLVVAVDFGGWMLLKFLPMGARRVSPMCPRWLPLQRSGHQASWHALRCTVHAARPSVEQAVAPPGI